ncbi:hypothetical protein [Ovoidimarina sediminis]|uniref:hypothetical protein n=1 Tax=Ovoidimarina sediminis TaxID=3079856 RepID=UPI00291086ED|nr:hypothetical protein [Rhodophyticola sp. MJ-SS7]MDU8942123.1 hypothetical protein [Rhodophyticola sp. MJ-SS7]
MTDPGDPDRILATLTPRGTRRWIGVLVQAALGALLLLLSATMLRGSVLWSVTLAFVGVVALYGAFRLIRATEGWIELTREELRSSSGQVLARMENVRGVDRGAFAFKPSNGFLVTLNSSDGSRTWVPGMWWKIGRLVGVGGVTPASEGKFMAEMISALLAERDGPISDRDEESSS